MSSSVVSAAGPPNGPSRLDSLTALRFFAALFVVLFHGWYTFTGRQGLSGAGFLNFGYTSVGFFFVLSGFVLAWSWRAGTPVTTLWWRRIARIFPLCALMTTAVAVYLVLVPESAPVGTPSWGSYLSCLFLLQAWPPFPWLLAYNYPGWSLSTELFFYLVFPFLVVLVARLRRPGLLAVAASLVVGYVVGGYFLVQADIYSLSPGSLLAFPAYQLLKFGLGVALGTAFRRGWRPRTSLTVAVAVLVALYALMGHLVTAAGPLADFRRTELFPDFVLLVPMAYLICAAAASDLRGTIGPGRWRALVVLGDWSFALYLVHAPVLMAVNEWRVRSGHLSPPGLWWLAVYAAVAVAASAVLHTVVERPAERALRSLLRRRSEAETETAQTPAHRSETRRMIAADRL